MSGYDGDADDALQFASFLLGIVDATAIYTIVVGAVLALFSLAGLIASFCAGSTMLKVYAGIVTVLLAAQIIVIAVIFAKPTEFTVSLTNTTQDLLELYGSKGEEGARATAIWRVLMETEPRCCGMDGYNDFGELKTSMHLI
ncbi:unnamed protein product [Hydatigera taeniaeformis]|uniref:Tetraspanin n=1 Tax=Hydatigena taeniaeformis TaxID=6205 RepID=A0A0R3WY77_HYDTA|nr:unnamed protein product [Hydatigera taeniaeformis]